MDSYKGSLLESTSSPQSHEKSYLNMSTQTRASKKFKPKIIVHTSHLENCQILENLEIPVINIQEDKLNLFKKEEYRPTFSKTGLIRAAEAIEDEIKQAINFNHEMRRQNQNYEQKRDIQILYYLPDPGKLCEAIQVFKSPEYQFLASANFEYVGKFSTLKSYKKVLDRQAGDLDLSYQASGGGDQTNSVDETIHLLISDFTSKHLILEDIDVIVIQPYKLIDFFDSRDEVYYKKREILSRSELNLLLSLGRDAQPSVVYLTRKDEMIRMPHNPTLSLKVQE